MANWNARCWLALVALGSIAAGAVLYATSGHGIGVTPDSCAYLSGADNLAHGRGYRDFTGSPITLWPPLYSNGPDIVWLRTGRSCKWVIGAIPPGATVIWFDRLGWRSYVMQRSEIAARSKQTAQYSDGSIYEWR